MMGLVLPKPMKWTCFIQPKCWLIFATVQYFVLVILLAEARFVQIYPGREGEREAGGRNKGRRKREGKKRKGEGS
jgi:hypothetical protein